MGTDKVFVVFATIVVAVSLLGAIFFTNIIPPEGKCLVGYILGGLIIIVGVYLHFK